MDTDALSRCAVKIRWGTDLEHTTQCEKPEDHYDLRVGNADEHVGAGLAEFPYQKIHWQPGDRREYVGEWPGNCPITRGCILHDGHHGRCAT